MKILNSTKKRWRLPVLLLCLIFSCQEKSYSPEGLTKMTEAEIYELMAGKRDPGGDPVFKNERGEVISRDSLMKIPNLREDWTIDIYTNGKGEVAEMIIRPASSEDRAFKEKLQAAAVSSSEVELVEVNCNDQIKILQEIHSLDQEMRISGNIDPVVDRENLARVISLIEQCGMPTLKEVGREQITAIWLVIQHADAHTRKKYFPYLQKAAQIGDLPQKQIAMMNDRILMEEGKPQLYGTQVNKNTKSNEWVLYDLAEPETVDKRRAEIGFEPLHEYLKRWDIEFTVEQVGL